MVIKMQERWTAKLPELSDEQEQFVRYALEGHALICDAVVGAGKTTAIMSLCNRMPRDKKILYLTYNKLLKIDAQKKIVVPGIEVTNYHGFAWRCLKDMGITDVGPSDLIKTFLAMRPDVRGINVLIMDEYQDIDREIADMLLYIKEQNPGIQIVAVGDMDQKIYDKTSLNVPSFMSSFLGDHMKLTFTLCFRLNAEHAANLSNAWGKKITGVNTGCKVLTMSRAEAYQFLSEQEPRDILCLGARTGMMQEVLNDLEDRHRDKFNKNTVFASIRDSESGTGNVRPTAESAIFTTYDSSKGLERRVCVLFDFTDAYWDTRLRQPDCSHIIMRNIFLVAASRGKEYIIFVEGKENQLEWDTIKKVNDERTMNYNDVEISGMFDYKHKEDVDRCFETIKVECISKPQKMIEATERDGLIDMSPCLGMYQEAMYFNRYNIDKEIEMFLSTGNNKDHLRKDLSGYGLERKILYLTSLETGQRRYEEQAGEKFMLPEKLNELRKRLSERLSPDEDVQVMCSIAFAAADGAPAVMEARGFADVVADGTVYELKFTTALNHEHFLQTASYMLALGLKKGILWNTKDGSAYSVSIPDKKAFIDAVTACITKGRMKKYHTPGDMPPPPGINGEKKGTNPAKMKALKDKYGRRVDTTVRPKVTTIGAVATGSSRVAVLDVETTWSDKVMSIGIVSMDIAGDGTVDRKSVKSKYFMIMPAIVEGGMFSNALRIKALKDTKAVSYAEAITTVRQILDASGISEIYAYNASFDKNHLPELRGYRWYDIMKVAPYSQYNPAIQKKGLPCYSSGKLKSGYGVEAMLRLMTGDPSYRETHNAYYDALDEAAIMAKLAQPLSVYHENAAV